MNGCTRCKTAVDGLLCPRCGKLTVNGSNGSFHRAQRRVERDSPYPSGGPTDTYRIILPKVFTPTDIVEEAE